MGEEEAYGECMSEMSACRSTDSDKYIFVFQGYVAEGKDAFMIS